MTADLKVGIVGAGGIGGTHSSTLLDVGGAAIVGVADPMAGAAGALAGRIAERAGTRPETYPSAAALLDAGDLDAIVVCTPPNDHVSVASAALERGVAVLCEKPPTRTSAELASLMEQAGPDALVQFGLCHVFEPGVRQAKTVIDQGGIGDVVHVTVRFGFRFEGLAGRWFADAQVAGGGIVLDTIVHSVSVFRHLIGEPTTVTALAATYMPDVHVEDSVVVTLQRDAGAVGILQSSWATAPGGAALTVHGTAGDLAYSYDTAELHVRAGDEVRTTIAQDPEFPGEGRFHAQARSFLAGVRAGRITDNTLADAAATMRVLDAAYASIDDRTVVTLG